MKKKQSEDYIKFRDMDEHIKGYFIEKLYVIGGTLFVGIFLSIAIKSLTPLLATVIAALIIVCIFGIQLFNCMENKVCILEGEVKQVFFPSKLKVTERPYIVIENRSEDKEVPLKYITIYVSKKCKVNVGNVVCVYTPLNSIYITDTEDRLECNGMYYMYIKKVNKFVNGSVDERYKKKKKFFFR